MDAGAIRIGPRGISKGDFDAAKATYGKHFGDAEDKSSLNVFTQNLWYLGNKVGPSAQLFSLKNLTEIQLELVQTFQELLSRPNEQEAVVRELFVRCLGNNGR